jgi:hypothetical protein
MQLFKGLVQVELQLPIKKLLTVQDQSDFNYQIIDTNQQLRSNNPIFLKIFHLYLIVKLKHQVKIK